MNSCFILELLFSPFIAHKKEFIFNSKTMWKWDSCWILMKYFCKWCLVGRIPGNLLWPLWCLAPKHVVARSNLPWIPKPGWPGRYINVWHCGRLTMVLLQLKVPLKQFVKRKEFLSGSRFQYDNDDNNNNNDNKLSPMVRIFQVAWGPKGYKVVEYIAFRYRDLEVGRCDLGGWKQRKKQFPPSER